MTDRHIPHGITREELLASLRTIRIDMTPPLALAPYVESDLDRFLLTFNLADIPARRALEIGANPYFLTILLKWFRPELSVGMINFFGINEGEPRQVARLDHPPRTGMPVEFEMPYTSVDIEAQSMPFDDASFDLVFFCEVLEHFVADPFHALCEIRRTLEVGGHLVLTTPNVARLENIGRMLAGANIYDPYSGFGPHGRHNREYTRHEVAWALRALGFEPVNHFTADVHPSHFPTSPVGLPLPPGREHDFGQYQFHLWRKGPGPYRSVKPAWLYRSMAETLDDAPL